MMNAATRPMMSRQALGRRRVLGLAGELRVDARPSCRWPASCSRRRRCPSAGSWNPVLSYWTSKNAIRPSFESWCALFASGSVLAETSLRRKSSERCEAVPAAIICWIAARRCGRVEPLARRRGDDDAQGRALLAAELGVDQVGRLLDVRPGEVEVVDQRAVEGGVQPDQDDEEAEPATITRQGWRAKCPAIRLRAGVGDLSSLFQDIWVTEFNDGRSIP